MKIHLERIVEKFRMSYNFLLQKHTLKIRSNQNSNCLNFPIIFFKHQKFLTFSYSKIKTVMLILNYFIQPANSWARNSGVAVTSFPPSNFATLWVVSSGSRRPISSSESSSRCTSASRCWPSASRRRATYCRTTTPASPKSPKPWSVDFLYFYTRSMN